jgi:hypothetical protein
MTPDMLISVVLISLVVDLIMSHAVAGYASGI